MTDYTELVKALKSLANGTWKNCEYTWFAGEEKVFADAAAAIEALQAELEKKRTADCWGCKCEKLEPKLGEIVRCKDCKWSISCGYISTRSYKEWKDWYCADGEREVQDGDK